jgi:triosephosphate isomerase
MQYVIANWKANKNYDEARAWCEAFRQTIEADVPVRNLLDSDTVRIVICPPFPFIPLLRDRLEPLRNVAIGAQSVSSHEEGAYTAEVTAKSLQGIVEYAIIGHSERRSYYGETDEDTFMKTQQCSKYGIRPILCIRGTQDTIHPGVDLIAYEPVEAIGTGKNMDPGEAASRSKDFALPAGTTFIYGGSVKADSAHAYLTASPIAGLLVGGASLDPEAFLAIVRAAA